MRSDSIGRGKWKDGLAWDGIQSQAERGEGTSTSGVN